MAHQVGGVARQRGLRIAADIVGIIVEEDVLNIGLERLLRAHRGGGHLHGRRRIHGHTCGSLGCAAVAFRHQMVSGRCRGSHSLNAGGGNVADAIDGYRGGIRRMPAQLHLVAGRDLRGSCGELRGRRGCGCRRSSLRRGNMRWFLAATCNSDHGDKQNSGDENAIQSVQWITPSADSMVT